MISTLKGFTFMCRKYPLIFFFVYVVELQVVVVKVATNKNGITTFALGQEKY
jgi:uncharacterized membrane protein